MKGKRLIASILLCSMIYIIPTLTYAEGKPTVEDFTKKGYKNTPLHFTKAEFAEHFTHEEGELTTMRFLSVPEESTQGTVKRGETPVKAGEEFPAAELDTLVFEPVEDYVGEFVIRWQASNGVEFSEGLANLTITIVDEAAPEESPSPSPTSEPTETPAPTPTLQPLHYDDMEGHWGEYSAGMIGSLGLIVGEQAANRFYFYPEKVLNRIEYIIYLNAVFGVEMAEDLTDFPFADADLPGYIRKQAMGAYTSGILSGSLEDGELYLHPYENLTRAEAAKLLDNALKVETPNTDPLDFSDVYDIPEWAAQAIKNMEGYGIIRGFDDNTFRPWANITKAQAAEMLYQAQKYQKQRALTNRQYVATSFWIQ